MGMPRRSVTPLCSELQTVVDKVRDRTRPTLVVCCTSRGSGESRCIGFPPCLCPARRLPRRSRQPEWAARGPAPYLRLLIVVCI
ncbi:hypothetical protein Y032_0699g1633 [Ancylostoma ceylanicum]|nr:hypothetical protein Y032_0699g1633 [Ancylostoma ceylanicum]